MCIFITGHIRRCGKSWGSVQWACWLSSRAVALELNVHLTSSGLNFRITSIFTSKIIWDQPVRRLLQQWLCITQEFLPKLPGRIPGKLICMWTQVHFTDGILNASYSLDPVVPFIHNHPLMLQHDNAQPQAARIRAQFLEVLAWLAWSYTFDFNSWKKGAKSKCCLSIFVQSSYLQWCKTVTFLPQFKWSFP